VRRLLVANRGEIAVRILRAATELGLETAVIASRDDAHSLHTRLAGRVANLEAEGPAAYLDGDRIVEVAVELGCDAVHPGYGFLSERPDFARRCGEAGLVFVGPTPDVLALFGDKARSRALAERCGIPVLPGTSGPTSLQEARAFLTSLGPDAALMVKAAGGGGGRGMRLVRDPAQLEEAYASCRSEALRAFGSDEVYVERFLPSARHVEVQVVGDGSGAVTHLWERECSLQRRHQKLVEMAPAPNLAAPLRGRLRAAAVEMAARTSYDGLGTFEFLVDEAGGIAFLEANARLQVEHTVTEEVTGVDLVKAQLGLADGRTLAELGLDQGSVPPPRGLAVELRVYAEELAPDGTVRSSPGVLGVFQPPSGPGVRVDTHGYAGYPVNPRFDPLLAKVVVHSPSGDLPAALARAHRALCEFLIEGPATNLPLLRNVVRRPEVAAGRVTTRFIDEHLGELLAPAPHPVLSLPRIGPGLDPGDPLAVLEYGRSRAPEPPPTEGGTVVAAPVQGLVVSVEVGEGERVQPGRRLLVIEAMKMHHDVRAERAGVVRGVVVAAGDLVGIGDALVVLDAAGGAETVDQPEQDAAVDLDAVRTDLAAVLERHHLTLDAARRDAVERRRRTGQRTARENLDDLCDPGSFVEHAPLVVAAQRQRRPLSELIERTPADGIVAGFATVNADRFGPERSACAVMAYDYTVLAGTQGGFGHEKMDRIFELAARRRTPLVVFAEGGGGRAGDTDGRGVSGFKVLAFHLYARLNGLVPLVAVVSGRCFAGNALLAGCADVLIATQGASLGMGGPAMIEGGGLGVYRPEEVGPMSVQVPNGVVDVLVSDEREAAAVARRYLSYFQGALPEWTCDDPRRLRWLVPEDRLRVYDVRQVIEGLADRGTVLELRRGFAPGMVTALARVEGRPLGIVANNPAHLAGAIDAAGADKAARFMQLCDAFGLPLLLLCDTPGIMVGPDAEKEALVRHAGRMFVAGANLGVPCFTIVLRKCYGLGALAMAAGSSKAVQFAVAWPTAEFGGMGLEGQVKLGYRKELAAIEDVAERRAVFERMVAERYEHGKAINAATFFEVDDVIDPADSRRWIAAALASAPRATADGPGAAARMRPIDTW
jgi:acetyl/propionyl-CoA carboxylase alpha subunit/acetyl-CoA carboxylase carboxyltransferase component